MSRTLARKPIFLLALAVAMALPVSSALSRGVTGQDAPDEIRAWSALEGYAIPDLVGADQPDAGLTLADQPYCDGDSAIAQTLRHDFAEHPVATRAGTELWGSAQMGTWTIVDHRDSGVTCIVGSGIGFQADVDPATFYQKAGFKS